MHAEEGLVYDFEKAFSEQDSGVENLVVRAACEYLMTEGKEYIPILVDGFLQANTAIKELGKEFD